MWQRAVKRVLFGSLKNHDAGNSKFVPPAPIVEGTPEATREPEICRFLKLPYDLKDANIQRGIAAWKYYNHKLMLLDQERRDKERRDKDQTPS